MTTAAKRMLALAALAVSTALGSGCVVVDLGKPVSFSREHEIVDKSTRRQLTLLEVKPEFEGRGSNATVRLVQTVQETTREVKKATSKRIDIQSQKRMAVGLFPAGGMWFYESRHTEHPEWAHTNLYPSLSCLVGVGEVLVILGTPYTLLVTPFTKWTATVGPYLYSWGYSDSEGWHHKTLDDVFSPHELVACGISSDYEFGKVAANFSLAGVVKYPVVRVHSEELGSKILSESVRTNKVYSPHLSGPFDVELRIPEVGFCKTNSTAKYESKVDFTLPTDYRAEEMEPCTDKWGRSSQRRRRYKGFLTFRNTGSKDVERSDGWWKDIDREAWSKVEGRSFEIELCLEKGPSYMNPQPVREVVERVVEKHYIHETRVEVEKPAAPEREFEVEKAEDGTWRVRILSPGLNALDVDRKAKPQILESLREEYASRNPDVPREEINAWATYTTEDGGRTLVYVGVAESLIPELESLEYSAETHRGMVRMRVREGADPRRSKEFVRQHISAIVCDKNVALVAGERPRDGAKYLSLDENLADGVLTVEFEAVE